MVSDSSLGSSGCSDDSKDVGQQNKEEIKKETSKVGVESEEIKKETSKIEEESSKFDVDGGKCDVSIRDKYNKMSHDDLGQLLEDNNLPFIELEEVYRAFMKGFEHTGPQGDDCSIGVICGGSGCEGCYGPSEDEDEGEEVESKKKKIKIEHEDE